MKRLKPPTVASPRQLRFHPLLLRQQQQSILRLPPPPTIPLNRSFTTSNATYSYQSTNPVDNTPPPPSPSPSPSQPAITTTTPPSQKNVNKTLHHTIATQTGLYSTLPYSPGSPFFLPHGTRIFNRLIEFLRAQYALYGFQEVITPTIFNDALWEKSGHLENFRDDMFRVFSGKRGVVRRKNLEEERGEGVGVGLNAGVKGEGEEEGMYSLKPMNCPGHCLLYKVKGHGYADLPLRFAEFAPLHRYGLTRVRRFHQDDAHIFCRHDQIPAEISSTLSMIETVYSVFGLQNYKFLLSTRPEKYMGSLSDWERAEEALKMSLEATGRKWTVNEGDGAFYGPKIDVILVDFQGKEHQTATVQLDFQLPQKFELSYDAAGAGSEDNSGGGSGGGGVRETPVIIHRAIFGSLERFMALLIEKYEKRWPFWMSPRQVKVIPVHQKNESIRNFAERTRDVLAGVVKGDKRQVMGKRTFYVDLEERNLGLNKSIREAKAAGYNVIVVIGESEVGSGEVGWDVWEGGKYVKKEAEGVEGVYQKLVQMEAEYQ
ncbi:hypothetical protein TWF703_001453 [Orbilia oligospora]|uniref:threonine--tRNA ligase n=1 Tax=Orbilia oligospora TaxID=2813651 RepID=A0A7C8JJH0_ORBOL|nr:hypothetical protein TWF703_001453 [Orbilia oligospora]